MRAPTNFIKTGNHVFSKQKNPLCIKAQHVANVSRFKVFFFKFWFREWSSRYYDVYLYLRQWRGIHSCPQAVCHRVRDRRKILQNSKEKISWVNTNTPAYLQRWDWLLIVINGRALGSRGSDKSHATEVRKPRVTNDRGTSLPQLKIALYTTTQDF